MIEAPVLVEDMRELRKGVTILGVECVECGGDHVGKLGTGEPSFHFPGTTFYPLVPQPPCMPGDVSVRVGGIAGGDVASLRVYRFRRLP